MSVYILYIEIKFRIGYQNIETRKHITIREERGGDSPPAIFLLLKKFYMNWDRKLEIIA